MKTTNQDQATLLSRHLLQLMHSSNKVFIHYEKSIEGKSGESQHCLRVGTNQIF